MKSRFAFLSCFAVSFLHAATPELDAAISSGDETAAIELFKNRELGEDDVARLTDWLASRKVKYRMRFVRAIAEKKATGAAAGKHIHSEITRLIKENLVEDDIDYTITLLACTATNKSPDLLYAVAPFVVHPQAKLRAEANRVIAAKRDERIYPILGQLLAGENAIDKVYAMETLLALKDERAVPLLLLQLSNPNKNVRFFALKTLEAINSDKAQYGIINLAQGDADEEVRLKAVEILRVLKTGPVFFALQRLIGDTSLPVRSLALESALAQQDKRYAYAISEQLARESEMRQKHALLHALLSLGSGGGMNGVLSLLRRENDADLLLKSAYACNRFAELRCADSLAAIILSPTNEAILLECLLALGSFRQRKHLSVLVSVMADEKQKPIVRSAAITAIALFDNEAAIAPLFESFAKESDQSLRVQIKLILTDLMRKKLPKA